MSAVITFTYDDETRVLDMGTMKMRESIECQNLTGWTWPEWREQLARARAEAVTFAWYLACKRNGDEVTYSGLLDELDQAKLGFDVELTDDDKADKPAELGAEEGPTSPAATAGEKKPRATK